MLMSTERELGEHSVAIDHMQKRYGRSERRYPPPKNCC